MIAVLLSSAAFGQTITSEALRNAPHTLVATYEKQSHWDPSQGRETWNVSITSNGTKAWAVATVTSPPPVYKPRGDPQYQGMDYYPGTDKLIVWRRINYAIEYDLKAGKASVCDAQAQNLIDTNGSIQVLGSDADYTKMLVTSEPLWSFVWAALGDSSIDTHSFQLNQSGVGAPGLPIAKQGQVGPGGDWVYDIALLSFTQAYDSTVKDSALAAIGLHCKNKSAEDDE